MFWTTIERYLNFWHYYITFLIEFFHVFHVLKHKIAFSPCHDNYDYVWSYLYVEIYLFCMQKSWKTKWLKWTSNNPHSYIFRKNAKIFIVTSTFSFIGKVLYTLWDVFQIASKFLFLCMFAEYVPPIKSSKWEKWIWWENTVLIWCFVLCFEEG